MNILQDFEDAVKKNYTSRKWAVIAVLCLAGAVVAGVGMGWAQYVFSWVGAMFRAASGGALFYFLARYIGGLDLSTIPEDRRALAGVALAILVGCGAIAVATGN